ncbi:MAG: lysophospholipid acyltransferase family protein [Bacteroidota bacterium]
MNQILYYLIVKPLSLLPLRVLYLLSDLIYPFLYYIVAYRKKVVLQNLTRAFPDRSAVEIQQLSRDFYRYLCDLLVESIRIFSISEREVHQRCRILNPEIFEPFVREKRSIVIAASHYGNWELAGLAVQRQIPHQVAGLFTPLSNAFWQKKLEASRTRFGLKVVAANKMKELLELATKMPIATVFINDQSPRSHKKRQYWTQFLNQETGVLLGAEKFARTYDYPILYSYNRRIKRGHYELEFVLIDDQPARTTEFDITERHLRLLEGQIKRAPRYWLWTHRRWKHQRPKDNKPVGE